jgi:hypothetical protein
MMKRVFFGCRSRVPEPQHMESIPKQQGRWRVLLALGLVLSTTVVMVSQGSRLAGAQSTLTIVPTQNVPGPTNNLQSISCVNASFCMAVGYSQSSGGTVQTLIEQWNGSQWSIVSSPATGALLYGVSCISTSFCMATGDSGSSGTNQTLIEQWNGTQWSIVSSPNQGTWYNYLNGVSCTSTSFCTAAGYYMPSGASQTLIEQWDGTQWSIVSSPNQDTANNYLNGVSCTSTSFCTAVGDYMPSGGGNDQTLIEQWNGTGWSIVTSPNQGTGNNELFGVSCTSTSFCMAAGVYVSSGATQTLIEQWNGTGWSIVTSPNQGTGNNQLSGVSCTSTSFCMAAGVYVSSGATQTLIEQWNGTGWSIVTSPNQGTGTNELFGVSCTSTSFCMAAGVYVSSGANQTLIEQWNGTGWSIVTSPNQGTGNVFYGISCTSSTFCIAVGYYGSPNQTLIEQWNGTGWSIVTSPNQGTGNNQLFSVSCTSMSFCVAVGYYVSSAGTKQTLIEQWNGTAWSIVSSPDTSANDTDWLIGVSCMSASFCMAVGYSQSSGGYMQTLIEQWNGSQWSIVSSPNTNSTGASLFGVSCTSMSFCMADGYYVNGYALTLIEQWDGSQWSIVSSPNTNSAWNNQLFGVSCTAANFCMAVGQYSPSTNLWQTLIEQWDGSTWSIVSSPNTSTTQSNYLYGVSCTTATTTFCMAVGHYQASISQTLAEEWDGPASGWVIDSSQNANSASYNQLTGVGCVGPSSCMVAGDYQLASGTYQTLAEQANAVPAPTVTSISPTSGPTSGGTTVTISGSNLSGGSVSFGANPATGVSCSASSCTATSPAGSGTVDVTVTTSAGTSATSSADQFTYTSSSSSPPPPSVTISATPTSQTSGASVTLTAQGTNVTSNVTIYKANGPNTSYPATYNSANWTAIGSPCNGSGNVVCTATDSETISSGSETWQYLAVADGTIAAVTTVTWSAPAPSVTSISPTSGPTSGGTTVTISGSNLTGGSVSFGANPATGVSCSASSCTATSPAGSGTVDVTVTTSAGTSATSASDQFTYTSSSSSPPPPPPSPPPPPAPSVTISVSPTSQTSGASVTLTAQGTNVTSNVTIYKANGPNTSYPATYNSANWTAIGSPCNGSGNVVCTATDSETISSGSETWQYLAVADGTIAAVTTVTWSAPAPSVTSISPTSGPTSGGTTVTISGSNLTGGSVSFGANPATGVSCSASSCTATSPAGSGTVDVTVTTSAGTSATSASDQFTYLATTITISASVASQTSGGSVTLTAQGTNVASEIIIYKANGPNTSYSPSYNQSDWVAIGSPCRGSGNVVCTATDSETISVASGASGIPPGAPNSRVSHTSSASETWQYLAVADGSVAAVTTVTWSVPSSSTGSSGGSQGGQGGSSNNPPGGSTGTSSGTTGGSTGTSSGSTGTSSGSTGSTGTTGGSVTTTGPVSTSGSSTASTFQSTPSATTNSTNNTTITTTSSGSTGGPPAPTNLIATRTGSEVILDWDPSISSGSSPVLGYYIYEGTSPGGESSTPLNSSPVLGTSYTVDNLADNTTYYFVVKAVSSQGTSDPSNEAQAVSVTAYSPSHSRSFGSGSKNGSGSLLTSLSRIFRAHKIPALGLFAGFLLLIFLVVVSVARNRWTTEEH